MSIVYWAIKDKVADEKKIPHVYVGTRKNGRKWKWIVDVDEFVDSLDMPEEQGFHFVNDLKSEGDVWSPEKRKIQAV